MEQQERMPMTPKLKRYRALKLEAIALHDTLFSFADGGLGAEFRRELFEHALIHAAHWSLHGSVTRMLETLMEQYEPIVYKPGEWAVIEGLLPPPSHLWIEFDTPLLTPDGPIAGAVFYHINQWEDMEYLATSSRPLWPHEKIVRGHSYLSSLQEDVWMVDWLNGDCTQLVRSSTFYPDRALGARWDLYRWDDCPHGACFPLSGVLCDRCQSILRYLPRWGALLQATLSGFFQETQLKECIREEKRVEKKPSNPKKRVYIPERFLFKVVDVSRRQVEVSPEELDELSKEKHSWVAGRPVLPFDAIDWAHPPSDETVILARLPVRAYTRTLRSQRFRQENRGKVIPVDAYEKPRMPMYFANWKSKQWRYIRARASLHEREEPKGVIAWIR